MDSAVRTGQPAPFEEYHEQDAWLESHSEWRIASSLAMWQAAGIRPEPATPRRLLDIACGCAIKGFALARQDPALQVTCVDTARVLPVARDLAARMGLLGQVEFVAADLLTADFGVASYDVALLGQITDYLAPAQNRDLLRRVHAALRPGGTLVIDVPLTGEELAEWTQVVSSTLGQSARLSPPRPRHLRPCTGWTRRGCRGVYREAWRRAPVVQ